MCTLSIGTTDLVFFQCLIPRVDEGRVVPDFIVRQHVSSGIHIGRSRRVAFGGKFVCLVEKGTMAFAYFSLGHQAFLQHTAPLTILEATTNKSTTGSNLFYFIPSTNRSFHLEEDITFGYFPFEVTK